MTNERLALMILMISLLLFLLTYPFKDVNFFIGMLNSGFGAAMVGGMADWFAVKALFSPVWIFPHTDILRRERAELTDALVDFASKDLLSVKNICDKLHKINFSILIIEYLTKNRGRELAINVVNTTINELLDKTNFRQIIEKIKPDIHHALNESSTENLLPRTIQMMIASRHTQKIYQTILQTGRIVFNHNMFQKILMDNIQAITKRYDEKGIGRSTVRSFTLNDEKILQHLNDWVNEKLNTAINNPDESYNKIRFLIEEVIQSEKFKQTLKLRKEELLENTEWAELIYDKINEFQRKNRGEIIKNIDKLTNWAIDKFIESPSWQDEVNKFIKKQAEKVITNNHNKLGEMVRRELDSRSDDDIVNLAKDSAGDDAHAIRISGSVVGAIAGMILYIFSFGFEHLFK